MAEILFYIYLIIGILIGIYDWFNYIKPIHDDLLETDTLESNMLFMYWICLILFWPIYVICKLFKKLF